MELLVVMAIISLLASILMPALAKAREKGRQANCINNLKQFAYALEMYRQDYNDWPPWLSNLYPNYNSSKGLYLCRTDPYQGTHGHGNISFLETGDYSGNTNPDPAIVLRNPAIEACSYFYEFCAAECAWWEVAHGTVGDRNGDEKVSWKEAKMAQMQGLDNTPAFGGHVPVIRCFWHNLAQSGPVLNLAGEDYNVYLSGSEWETSSR